MTRERNTSERTATERVKQTEDGWQRNKGQEGKKKHMWAEKKQ